MDPFDVTQIINTVGFPVAACGGLFWMINTSNKELTNAVKNLNESIIKLTTKMGDDKDGTRE